MAGLQNLIDSMPTAGGMTDEEIANKKKAQDFQNTYGGGGADSEKEQGLDESLPFLGSTKEDHLAPKAGTLMMGGGLMSGTAGEILNALGTEGQAAGSTLGKLVARGAPAAGAAAADEAPALTQFGQGRYNTNPVRSTWKQQPGSSVKVRN